MITLAWYLLKVIICSGILCGYYFLALRNKAFHRWNRFYLLASIVLSLLIPVMKINIFQNDGDKGAVINVLQTISYGDEAVIEYNRNSGFELNTQNLAETAYLLISAIFLSIFFIALFKIIRLKKKNPETKIEGISFITTNAKGTPFSFFNSIFWNNAIDLHSKPGQQIFNHEIAHVKEKHSYDKIFMNVVLIFLWINPFFWLIQKELNMIHEFIADKEALEDNDINAFAEMILQTVYPGENFSITNGFFYSPIKRRLLMLTKNKNSKVSYVSRLLVLPLAAIVFFAFTLKVKNSNSIPLYDGKTITVVIDAGHGGDDHGAIHGNIQEKDLTLAIAQKVKELNDNKNINIVLTRDKDEFISVKDRTNFTNEQKADLFVSIHINSEDTKNLHSGLNILIPNNDNGYSSQSKLLGSSIIASFKNNYPLQIANNLVQRKKGLWVLTANQCPSVLIEAGFLTSEKDRDYLSKTLNQETVAKNILNGIENYAQQKALSNVTIANVTDTIPPMYYKNKKVTNLGVKEATNNVEVSYSDGSKETITKEESLKRGFILPPPPPPGLPPHYFQTNALFVIDGKISTNAEAKRIDPMRIKAIYILKKDEAVKKYGDKGKNGVIELTTKNKDEGISVHADTVDIHNYPLNKITDNFSAAGNVILINSKTPSGALIIVNGKEILQDELKNISPNNIQSITVLKAESAEEKYGLKGKNGVIEIVTKPFDVKQITGKQKDTIPGKIFTKVESEASFPGGQSEWVKYIIKNIQASLDSFTEDDFGTCVLKFIVNRDGSVSNIEATTMKGTQLAKISINAIKYGPNWIPASQNGKAVASYRLQPVTLTNPDDDKKKGGNSFTKIEQPASFPGGHSAWLKYISRIFQKDGNELIGNENNSGTCKVKFIVKKDGSVSDVLAITMKGTQLAELAVNAIKKGPRWNPGMQNGQSVNSYVIQPVTFKLDDKIGIKGEPE